MEVSHALHQLAEIQDKLSRSQVYRGYRPFTVGLTSLCALFGGWLSHDYPPALVWPCIACLCLALVGGEMAYDYAANFGQLQRRLCRRVLQHFVPGISLGGAWTAIWMDGGHSPAFLPSLWAMTYSLCLFGARPNLPAGVGYVALFYGLCALALCTPLAMAHFNLGMTLTFTLGQCLLALILHWNQPRGQE